MDRRASIRWILSAGAGALLPGAGSLLAAAPQDPVDPNASVKAQGYGSVHYGTMTGPGYGSDPVLVRRYHPGELWPLTFTPAQRELAATLADLIIPADEHSPGAVGAGVVDFLDEWVSAPYPDCQRDRPIILGGFDWLETESERRFQVRFVAAGEKAQVSFCDALCSATRAPPELAAPARFFALFRKLTAAAFYSSPAGRADLDYRGNVALARFDGAPPALLRKLGLA